MYVVSVGEILWDVIDGREYLGGAPLNFAVHSARLGHRVALVSGVGDDPRGRLALERAHEFGLDTRFIRIASEAPTGIVTVSVDSGGQPSYAIHRPAAYDFASLDGADLGSPDWVASGTLYSMNPSARRVLDFVLGRCPAARRFYDINLRPDSYTAELVGHLLARADVVKLNDDEVVAVQQMLGTNESSLEVFCRACRDRFHLQAICVTRGADGCALLLGNQYLEAPGIKVVVADTVGAGDAFAAALLHGLDAGWPAPRIADFANRLGALVASRPGGTPPWSIEEIGPAGTGMGYSPPE